MSSLSTTEGNDHAEEKGLSLHETQEGNQALRWITVVLLIYGLLIAVGMIGTGFKTATGDKATELFAFASNPFAGLVIGTVATALIQSSSTVSSIIVALVAGGLPVGIAIPMIMGANIGTTITNTLVSLGHVRDGQEFRRAFAAATVHDFFNLISVVIFLPLEMLFHPLQKLSAWIVQPMVGSASLSMSELNFMKTLTKPPVTLVKDLLSGLGPMATGIIMAVGGIALIFLVITYIGKLLRKLMVGKAKAILHTAIGRGPLSGISSGTLVTVLVQSSSTTTSLVVPLAGTGVFTLRQIYPFCLGANIGTCITALLAATAISGETAVFAMQIAIVHLLYNILGVLVIFGLPILREWPIKAAEWLAEVAAKQKLYALAYVVGTFFLIPAILIGVSSAFDKSGNKAPSAVEEIESSH
ncbi:Na/Pi symporter [Roseibacillus ishigakijimensis]|uniref:Na/Pi cotransporter family protein n=1 Tax=Roseibacillus ishigakijimensis TaxID=454146 RepID=A0A934RM97_9BACT|nr:Na/Pi symporter [Roseibacillus ishigakijimensis]MBK1834382.1 Na/Pi cotransporter family protein [Roseibacillus ishigakijimensis]